MALTPFSLEFHIRDAEARLMLDYVKKKLIDLSPEMKEIATYINSEIQDHFNKQINPGGRRWISSKAAILENRQTLIKTRKYRRAVKATATKANVFVKSSHPGINTHEKGLSINIFGRGVLFKFQKRSVVWLSKKNIDDISKVLIRGY